MSTPVKKESTKKKSTKSAKAETVKTETANAESVKEQTETVAKKAPAKKTTAKKAVVADEPEVAAEEPVKKTRGRKAKTAEEIPVEEEPVKKPPAARKPNAAAESKVEPEAESESQPDAELKSDGETGVEEPAPKRKYTRRKKTDDAEAKEDAPAETESVVESAVEKPPAKKPGRRSKKDIEAEAAASDDGADIETRVYNLIKNTPGGVYQNEIWKQLDIDSRKCSRILKKLLDSDQILREEAVAGGTKTFLLKTVAEERKRNYDVLMVKGTFSPCTGCMGECRPEYCPALTFWIMNIHNNPEELYAAMGYNSNAEPEHEEVEMPPEFLEEMEAGEYDFGDEGDGDSVFE
ncbi:hypothetical protein MmiEs2_04830 [Methanimicrococcus stummii]|uniref:B-block binding subunit of TFIIIC domain-containing protein n=1 Tax=Methanimicrococcus stummii TaxID=3028294 RepID=A0AA96V7R8_9EURY|nr:hypothetical protein [Methanimicrococcus sp. Es2]WNY28299.1 hypothetical protein MmiEs2_04830 [Methanimicrococcus sp. Es2]